MIGGLIMVHGDDKGLRLPPRVAPIQVVIVPIMRGAERDAVLAYADRLQEMLSARFRVRLDARPEFTPGYKYNDWEMRGVPLRIEVGPRDVAQGAVVMARRDTGDKAPVMLGDVVDAVATWLDDIQAHLLEEARQRLAERTVAVSDYREAAQHGYRGFFTGDWCGQESCAEQLKADTGMTIRCLPLDAKPRSGRCVVCQGEASERMVFARAY
jgi:prolyl-tRNA synthetase